MRFCFQEFGVKKITNISVIQCILVEHIINIETCKHEHLLDIIQVDNGNFLGRYFLGALVEPFSKHEEFLRMSPSERYLAITVGPDINAAIQALLTALLSKNFY